MMGLHARTLGTELRLLGSAVVMAAGVGLLGTGCASTAAPPPPTAEHRIDLVPVLTKMDEVIHENIQAERLPGAVVAVGLGGRMVDLHAVGNRELGEQPVAMTNDTVFDLASVSKVMGTATATMLLIEDGKLTLDTTVGSVLPEYADSEYANVTVGDLLTHRSGLRAYEQVARVRESQGDGPGTETLLPHLATLPKSYPTGEYYLYSCLNFLSLARLNETVAGESQESLLRRRVWEPLGMKDTTYLPNAEQKSRLAPQFRTTPASHEFGSVHDPLANFYGSTMEHCPGNAGLFSTAADMAKYLEMIAGRGTRHGVRVFKPETIDLMTSTHLRLPQWRSGDRGPGEIVTRGLGWHVYADAPWTHPAAPVGSFIGHTGYTGTFIWVDMNSRNFVVLLANSVYMQDPPQTTQARRGVVRHLLEATYGPFGDLASAD